MNNSIFINNDCIKEEEFNKLYEEYQRRFVSGEQYIAINHVTLEINLCEKRFWFEKRQCYNIIKHIVDGWVSKNYTNLWGKGNYVDQLIPYQQSYNDLMNQVTNLTERLCYPTFIVEDGSIDVDELEEDGLCPGKILIYRQGSNEPNVIKDVDKESIEFIYSLAEKIKDELNELASSLEFNMKDEENYNCDYD